MHPFDTHPGARAGRRAAAGAALLTTVALAVGGCSSSGSSTPAAQSSGAPGTASGDAAPMSSTVRIGTVAGNVHQPYRQRFAAVRQNVETAVGHAVDAWIDGGFVGVDYPRDSFPAAFSTFTPQARRDAERGKALMTLWGLRHRIDGVTATRRTVVIDVLAPRGRPAAATARVDLHLTTSGDATRKVQVTGRLFLAKAQDGSWRVFGYDVSKGAGR